MRTDMDPSLGMLGRDGPGRIRARPGFDSPLQRPARFDHVATIVYLCLCILGFRLLGAPAAHTADPAPYLVAVCLLLAGTCLGIVMTAHAFGRVTTVRSLGMRPLVELPPRVWVASPFHRDRYVAISHQERRPDGSTWVAFADGTGQSVPAGSSEYRCAFQAWDALDLAWEPASLDEAHLRRLADEF